jgi:hypothetical protein
MMQRHQRVLRVIAAREEWLEKAKEVRAAKAKARRHAEDASRIIERLTPWAGSLDQAMAWYRSQPIPGFGNKTAEALVRAGKARLVHEYLDGIAVGGFA